MLALVKSMMMNFHISLWRSPSVPCMDSPDPSTPRYMHAWEWPVWWSPMVVFASFMNLSQVGLSLGHCHKWSQFSVLFWSAQILHLCRAPPLPLSHSALWSMFLNHDPVSLVVPMFLANSFPIPSHGRFRVNFSPHASLHLGVTFILELFLIALPRSCVVILSSLLLLITPLSVCSLGSG